jgi:hypothetical protein
MIFSKTFLLVAALCFTTTDAVLSGGRRVGNRKESSSSAGPRGQARDLLELTEELVTDNELFNGAFGDEALLSDLLRGGMSMGGSSGMGMGMGGSDSMGMDSSGMGGGGGMGGGSGSGSGGTYRSFHQLHHISKPTSRTHSYILQFLFVLRW